jgi:hypothetical protein
MRIQTAPEAVARARQKTKGQVEPGGDHRLRRQHERDDAWNLALYRNLSLAQSIGTLVLRRPS